MLFGANLSEPHTSKLAVHFSVYISIKLLLFFAIPCIAGKFSWRFGELKHCQLHNNAYHQCACETVPDHGAVHAVRVF